MALVRAYNLVLMGAYSLVSTKELNLVPMMAQKLILVKEWTKAFHYGILMVTVMVTLLVTRTEIMVVALLVMVMLMLMVIGNV